MIAQALQDAGKGKGIPHEDVMAELEKALQEKQELAVWDRSMNRPYFEE